MTQLEKYKFLCGTRLAFERHGPKGMQAFVYEKDKSLKIYFRDESYPSLICNVDFLAVFDEYNQKYYGDELKQKLYDKAIELLTKQLDECRDEAKELAKKDTRILKVRCVYEQYVDGKKQLHYVSGRSDNINYVMSECYGMTYEDCLKECKRTVNEWRSCDRSDWHVLDEHDSIIY